jgi:hypothetical protein
MRSAMNVLEQMIITANQPQPESIRFNGSDYSTDKQFRLFSPDR